MNSLDQAIDFAVLELLFGLPSPCSCVRFVAEPSRTTQTTLCRRCGGLLTTKEQELNKP